MPNEIGYSFNRVSTNPIETDRQVNTITLRDAIPSGKRWEGMLVYVISEQTTYELKGGILNTDWAEIGGTDTTATHYRGEFDATALDPAIDNSNGVQGDEYKVVNGGVNVDFGAGDIFLETGDIIIFNDSLWGVKVSPNYGSSYLVPYELATAGQTVIPVDAEFVNVSLTINRVPQVKDIDFTFTSGTITMLYALDEDALIDVRGYKLDGEYPSNLQPIPNVYDDLADLIAHQASQLTGYIYEVTDASDFTGIDSGKLWVRYLGTTLGTEADYSWEPRTSGTGAVDSVNGQTGTVVLDADDIDDSSTTNKFTTAAEISKLAGIETSADVTDAVNVGSSMNGATAKTTPVDADTFPLNDSADSNLLKKVTWSNIKATLNTALTSFSNWLEEKLLGTATYNGATTGTANLDISAFSSHYAILTGNTTHTLTGIPASGKTVVKTLYVESTATESYAIANADYTIGSYVADGTLNRVTIEATTFPTIGEVITVTYENLV